MKSEKVNLWHCKSLLESCHKLPRIVNVYNISQKQFEGKCKTSLNLIWK